MRSGGYSVSKDIPQLGEQTIIFWGANDEILDKESVKRFAVDLPRSRYSIPYLASVCSTKHADKHLQVAGPAHCVQT